MEALRKEIPVQKGLYEADSDWSDSVEEAEPIPAHDDDGYLSEGDKYREEEWG